MESNKLKSKRYLIFRIVRIAIFACILFVQEELLSFIPNVQFTQVLIAIYYYAFGLTDTLIVVILHTLFDNLFMASFNIVYTPAMLVGWISLVLILYLYDKLTINSKLNNNKYIISSIVGLHGLIYSWCFLITSVIFLKVEFIPYLISDIPFEIILVVVGFLSTFLLLNPLVNVLKKLDNKYNTDDSIDEDNNLL